MPIPDNSSTYKRTNLFLLRVWCDDADENENSNEGEGFGRMWHGRVQRTVSGEAHNFEGKDDLIQVLQAMLCKDRPGHSKPRGKTSSEAGHPTRSNNQTGANEEGHPGATKPHQSEPKRSRRWVAEGGTNND
jgi:hypothetical protein